MSDVPNGEWSSLLVGHQWPGSASLAALGDAARRRAAIAVSHGEYAGNLHTIRTVTLGGQQGITAEKINAAFENGERTARGVSEANTTKRDAYGSALRHATELRGALTDIANQGNSEIQSILASPRTLPEKLSAIVSTVVAAQTHANSKAAECSANLFETIQSVCATETPALPARRFAHANGVDLGRAFGSPDTGNISSQVERMLRDHPSSEGMTVASGSGAPPADIDSPGSVTASPPVIGPAAIPELRQDSPAETRVPRHSDAPVDSGGRGGPVSAGAEAILTAAGDTVAHQTPRTSESPGPVAQSADTGAPPAAVAPPHAAAAAPVTAHLATAAPLPPGHAPTVVNAFPPAQTTTQQGPLPAYAADLKPTAITPPAGSTTIPAAPSSAPVGPAGGAGPGAPPTIVRTHQPPIGTVTSPPVTGSPERALATASTPAAAGTARTPEEVRLRRILHFIARQRPELLWAVGDLDDGTTVLFTDLAGGWIPPDLDIPVGITLPRPGVHRIDPVALLGGAAGAVTYRPGQPLDPDPEPVPTSIRSRDARAVDDLGWKLSRATKWRDGLPRLAHTLARAATARTGYLDAEVQLLREHLRAVSGSVLARYPTGVERAEVGNWQLLAAIDALLSGEKTSADYHFAWFLTSSPQSAGDR